MRPRADPAETPHGRLMTPAGGQRNSDWEHLDGAVRAFALWRARAMPPGAREAAVVFRCGTVARVAEGDAEFAGYVGSLYSFPDLGPSPERAAAEAVPYVVADNARVWEAQKNLGGGPLGAEVAVAVRRAYALALSRGAPYPDAADSECRPINTGIRAVGDLELWTVFWPARFPGGRVLSLSLVPPRSGARDAAREAAAAANEHVMLDYMFPEVAAVVTPDGALWAYRSGNVFAPLGE